VEKIGSYIPSLHPELHRRARLLAEMTASARSRLAPNLAPHCWISNFDGPCVTLVTDEPCLAIHLRHQQREIIKQLNEEFALRLHQNFTRIRVRVSSQPIGKPVQPSSGIGM